MQLVSEAPNSWQDLQKLTASLLNECGYNVVIEKDIHTLRGLVNVDVYASKEKGYNDVVICECKYWSSKVPQTVVHAFRSIIVDYGASHGFVISKNGFQKGAYGAAQNSNVSLFNWEEFKDKFTIEWLKHIVERNSRLGKSLQALGTFLISNGNAVMPEVYEQYQDRFLQAREAYDDFVFLSFSEHYISTGREVSRTEIDKRIETYQKIIPFRVSSYKEYFDYIYNGCQNAIAMVEVIFENKFKWEDYLSEKGC